MTIMPLGYTNKKDSTLVGHVPVGFLTLLDNFLNADKENRLKAEMEREVGLVVPAELTGRTMKLNIATILQREIYIRERRSATVIFN